MQISTELIATVDVVVVVEPLLLAYAVRVEVVLRRDRPVGPSVQVAERGHLVGRVELAQRAHLLGEIIGEAREARLALRVAVVVIIVVVVLLLFLQGAEGRLEVPGPGTIVLTRPTPWAAVSYEKAVAGSRPDLVLAPLMASKDADEIMVGRLRKRMRMRIVPDADDGDQRADAAPVSLPSFDAPSPMARPIR